jgi:integrase
MSLTDARVKALKPTTSRYLETDGRGLSMDVLPSGKKTWIFKYRRNGKQERMTLGQYPDLSLADARAERDRLAQKVVKGESPAEQRRKQRAGGDPTLAQFSEKYYREVVLKDRKDPAPTKRYLDKEIAPHLGGKLLKDVTVLDVQKLIYRKRDAGKVSTALHLRIVLKGLFDYGLELQLCEMNPAVQVSRRYIGKLRKRERALSPNDLRIFLRTLDEADLNRQFKLALRILMLTLVRKGELLQASWEHVDFDAGVWTIPAAHTKTNQQHVVYMSSQVADLFRELHVIACGSPFVLPGQGMRRPLSAVTLNNALARIKFDLAHFTIHDFRRTGSTILNGKGFAPDVVEAALGHQIPGVRGIYNRSRYEEEQKRMLQFWGDYVDSIVNGSNVIVGNFGA